MVKTELTARQIEILSAIYREKSIDRTALATITMIPRTSLYEEIEKLHSAGLIRKTKRKTQLKGRYNVFYSIPLANLGLVWKIITGKVKFVI